MKKLSIIAALILALTVGFTSCKEDTTPRLEIPTEFVLNTPPFSNMEYLVEQGGSISFTCSQANYGLATTPEYQIQVSKTEDFKEFKTVEYTTTMAKMTIPAEAFSLAVCELYGWDDPEKVTTVPLYVRCTSHIKNTAADSEYNITSNVIKLNQVKVYFAVKLPDAIYLIGQPQGWKVTEGTWPIYETEPGSRIYKGAYEIPAGQFQFRFYDELGDWDFYSIGSQDPDNTKDITMTNGTYTGDCFYDPATKGAGKGGWQISGWEGGMVEITVNLNSMTVVFQKQ